MENLKDLLLNLKMVMFGGKGGVGKTSSAASAGIWAAEHGRKTLIISTDPAHSLGDSLGMELLAGEIVPVNGVENLFAMEINPSSSMDEFQELTQMNPIEGMGMPDMMSNMPFMGDIGELGGMNPPGIDEAMAFKQVLEFVEKDTDYDLIIFDTAPTGHTLRLLSLPETLSSWLVKLLKMKVKLKNLFGTLGNLFKKKDSKKEKDVTIDILEQSKDLILKARNDLQDPSINSFVIVMIPEEMAIAETGRLLNELIRYGIPNEIIIVNQLLRDTAELCDFCSSRKLMQQRNLDKIKEIFRNKMEKNLIEVPLFKEEIREYDKLKEMGEYLIE